MSSDKFKFILFSMQINALLSLARTLALLLSLSLSLSLHRAEKNPNIIWIIDWQVSQA